MRGRTSLSASVVICECFARDGLQNEAASISTSDKVAVIDAASRAGFRRIEATSYSHPAHVPVFSDASQVLASIERGRGAAYKATCPNLRAVERALEDKRAGHGADELSLLASATDGHSQRNLRATRAEQWQRIEAMAEAAKGEFTLVGVISMATGCVFEGAVDPDVVVADVERFARLGAELVTIGDTVGLGTPSRVKALFARILRDVPEIVPVAHFHNSKGTALANCMAALEAGATHFDSAMGGVGGHPTRIEYGLGHTGNVPTEDLVNLLEGEGVDTGIDLAAMMEASALCETVLDRPLKAMVARSGLGLGLDSGRGEAVYG